MEKAISALCDTFISWQVIQADDKALYEYCFTVLVMSSLHYLLCFVIMCYYQCFLLPFIFTVVYQLLRSYMGGWHANSMWICLFIGLLLFIAVVNLLLYTGLPEQGKLLFSGFSVLFTGWAVHRFGMQDHPNRRLNGQEKVAAKRKFCFLLALISLLMLLAALFQQVGIIFSMALACFAATAMLLLAKFQQKGVMNHETQ